MGEYKIGIDKDQLGDFISANLANSLDLNTLLEIKRQMVKNGDDTELIDGAIEYAKKMNSNIDESSNLIGKAAKVGALASILDIFSNSKSKNTNSDLMPWEQDLVDKGEYEPYHFEEEEMDEDDYYYEDD
ncbi:MAG: hypothetical protein IJ565_01165 [Bacilli bacterium]|nr:hypothetical protein [Bacilli bacterium]